MRVTYKKVKDLLADMGIKVCVNPSRPGYLLTYQRENRVYGPFAAVNLKDCIGLGVKILDQFAAGHESIPVPDEWGKEDWGVNQ
jgi:hypothetical protein